MQSVVIIITRTYIRVPDTNAQRFAIPGKVGDLLSHIRPTFEKATYDHQYLNPILLTLDTRSLDIWGLRYKLDCSINVIAHVISMGIF